MNQNLTKIKKIKLLLSDVDGVLTDGGMYYSNSGEFLKKFNTRDAFGIPTILITRENSIIVKKRAAKIKVKELFSGIMEKEKLLEKISKKYNLSFSEIAYIGDDLNDLKIIKKIGFSASPNDAVNYVRKNVDYICKCNGGNGALREFIDYIILKKGFSLDDIINNL
ncbi:MAG: 3-deoxy-D-manno-octulosonate 8-phosphate phosphatase [Thaumarchaeota archaeon]|nr:MAG: 3-deoxy-D-manno-octulosonate 8-phosphate phosphatase [Nitrososphaerota archaeon]